MLQVHFSLNYILSQTSTLCKTVIKLEVTFYFFLETQPKESFMPNALIHIHQAWKD